MNGDKALASEIKTAVEANKPDAVQVCICPPVTLLSAVLSDKYLSGVQDVSANESGAYTGELSAEMLRDSGAQLVIVGHSERRSYHFESDSVVAEKAKRALAAGLTPIVCFGEPEDIRDADTHIAFCIEQIKVVLNELGTELFGKCVLAYEPVWAIGTGKTATPEQAQEMHAKVRSFLAETCAEMAEKIQILYGGSVKGANAKELFTQADIDGGLIGGASLKADEFLKIVLAAN